MNWRRSGTLVLLGCLTLTHASIASADPDVGPEGDNPLNPTVAIDDAEEIDTSTDPSPGAVAVDAVPQAAWKYEWLNACLANYPGQSQVLCANAYNCAESQAIKWTLWALPVRDEKGQPIQGASWQPVLTQCRLTEPAEIATPRPQVTDALVLSEVKRLGLPRLTVEVQPADATLVNFETIFYAEPQSWDRTVTLLDYTVDVHAEPTTYVWRFGDGASLESQSPGAPYPHKDVTHLYSDAGVVVSPQVDTAYEIRYRVDGGPWQTISETVPAAGLPIDLRIREATAVLVGD